MPLIQKKSYYDKEKNKKAVYKWIEGNRDKWNEGARESMRRNYDDTKREAKRLYKLKRREIGLLFYLPFYNSDEIVI